MGLPIEINRASQPYDSFDVSSDPFSEKRTVGGTLGDRALAATTTDANTVDNIALLGLVSETARLVGAGGAGGTVDNVQLTELY